MTTAKRKTFCPPGETTCAHPVVLIYTPHLLTTVQHYVREHAVRLRRYRGVLAGRRRVAGTPVDDIPHFTFGTGPLARLQEIRFLTHGSSGSLTAFVRKHNVRLIHAHFGTGGTEIMKIAADLGLPLVTTFHGWDVKLGDEAWVKMSRYERLYRSRLPAFFNQAASVICVSQDWSKRVVQLGCPPSKVMTNYLGVDANFFDGRDATFDSLSVLFVGRLVRRKGVAKLIEAIRLLQAHNLAARLTVVGEGPERAALEAHASSLNVSVKFTGKKDRLEVRDLLRNAAVLCAPSTTSGGEVPEALGLVLVEAQAMGVPVVGTRNGGIPETMQDGKTGYLVDQDSAQALAEALAKLLGNKSVNQVFGERARSFVCDRFAIDRSYENLEALYDNLLQSNLAGP